MLSLVYSVVLVGDYTSEMYAAFAEPWGLYTVKYQSFGSKLSTNNKMDETTAKETYDRTNAMISYKYGNGEETINDWDERNKVEAGHYILQTKRRYYPVLGSGTTEVYLSLYRQEDKSYNVCLYYYAPNYDEYMKRIDSDIKPLTENSLDGF